MASDLLSAIEVRVAAYVLDANLLLKDIKYSTEHGKPTFLQKAARIGLVRFYVSTTVRDEVEEKLRQEVGDVADWARRRSIDLVDALRRWECDYAPWIMVLDPSELPASPKVKALRVRDPDDVETAQLIEWLPPEAAFSADKDLRPFGVIPGELAAHARVYLDDSIYGASKVGVTFSGGIVLLFTASTVKALLGLLGRRWLPIGVVLAGGTVLALLHPNTRGRVLDSTRSIMLGLAQAGEFLSEIAKLFGQLKAQAAESRLQVPNADTGTEDWTPPSRALEYLGLVMGTAPAPLSVYEITARMEEAGYKPRGERPDRYVSRLLHQHPLLFEVQVGRRWQLRSHANLVSAEQVAAHAGSSSPRLTADG